MNGGFSLLRNNNNENGSKGNLFDGLNGINIGIGNTLGSGSGGGGGGGGDYDGNSGISMRSNNVFGQSPLSSHLLSSDVSSQQRPRSHSFTTHENTLPPQSSTSGNSSSTNHSIYEDSSLRTSSGRPTSIFNNNSIGGIGLTPPASSNSSLATALAAAGDSLQILSVL